MREYQQSSINFSNPVKGRRWLNILRSAQGLGMTLLPNLDFSSRDILGFTFKSNRYGFHGKECAQAKNIILGTSFGMGFGVDEGKNWFQLNSQINDNFFNLAMPVAPFNHLNALSKYYKGDYETLVYVYHPNVWKIGEAFYSANKSNDDLFTFMRWKTHSLSLIKLIPRWTLKKIYFYMHKIELAYKKNGYKYIINTNYNQYDSHREGYENTKEDLLSIFKKFNKVIIYRVPIKEQILNNVLKSSKLKQLNKNYDECWESLIADKRLLAMNHLIINDLCCGEVFKLEDYLPNDTHWSPLGNKKFSKIVAQQLHELNK